MILDFRDSWLEAFYVEDKPDRRVPADPSRRLFRKLQMIDDSTSDQDLRVPPSNHFEKLSGNLRGWRSIRVSDQWRLIFKWDGTKGEASEVYLDNHTYRG
jgi:toxin HigB-1